MQYIVSQSFANKVVQDPLAETETLEDLALCLSKQGLSAEATNSCSRLLSHRRFVGIQRTAKEPIEEVSPEVMKEREIEVSEEEEEQREGVERNIGVNLQAWHAERTKTRRGAGYRHKDFARTPQAGAGARDASFVFFIIWDLATCCRASISNSTCIWERRCHVVITSSKYVKRCAKAGIEARDDASRGTDTSSSTDADQ